MRQLLDLPKHWRSTTDPRRLTLGRRLDRVELAVDIDADGAVKFLAIFPNARAAELEGADSVPSAVAMLEEKWPPAEWMLEEVGEADFGPGVGTQARLPFVMSPGGDVVLHLSAEDDVEHTEHISLQCQAMPYAAFKVIGLDVKITGKYAWVIISFFGVDGDINLLYADEAVTTMPKDGEEPLQERELYGLRKHAILQPGQGMTANLNVTYKGAVLVEVGALVETVYDPSGATEGQGIIVPQSAYPAGPRGPRAPFGRQF